MKWFKSFEGLIDTVTIGRMFAMVRTSAGSELVYRPVRIDNDYVIMRKLYVGPEPEVSYIFRSQDKNMVINVMREILNEALQIAVDLANWRYNK